MMNTTELQADVDQMQRGECTLDELRAFARHPAGLVRVNAVDAIAKYHSGEEATRILVQAAEARDNDVKLIGIATIAFVAIGRLLASTDSQRRNAGIQVVGKLPDDVRSLLGEYLDSEGIRFTET
jgi:hypothetical protein